MNKPLGKPMLLRLAFLALGFGVAQPTDSSAGLAGGAEPLLLLARFEVGEPGRIDLSEGEGTGDLELLITYRELGEDEPEAAEGRQFTMAYSWSQGARSFLPARLMDGVVIGRSPTGGLFPGEDCLDPTVTMTRRDVLVRAKPADVTLSLIAAERQGARMPVPEQSLKVIDTATAKAVVLEPEIRNLYFAAARAVDVDHDGVDEIILSTAYYKNRAVYFLGRQGKDWRQIAVPSFTKHDDAEAFLRAHGAGARDK